MTAQALFKTALALMPAISSDAALEAQFIPVINLLMAENLNIENGLRRHQGLPQLLEPPLLTVITEEIPYDWRLLRIALVYGVAGTLYAEDDAFAASAFLNKYEYERSNLIKGEFEAIEDYYGGGS